MFISVLFSNDWGGILGTKVTFWIHQIIHYTPISDLDNTLDYSWVICCSTSLLFSLSRNTSASNSMKNSTFWIKSFIALKIQTFLTMLKNGMMAKGMPWNISKEWKPIWLKSWWWSWSSSFSTQCCFYQFVTLVSNLWIYVPNFDRVQLVEIQLFLQFTRWNKDMNCCGTLLDTWKWNKRRLIEDGW